MVWRRTGYLLLAAVLLFMVYVTVRDVYIGRRLHYEISPEALIITWPERIAVDYDDVHAVTFFRVPPPLPESFPNNLSRSRIGRFYLEGTGWVQFYAADVERSLLVVHTGPALFGLTPPDGVDFHQRLLARLREREKPQISMRSAD